MRKISLSVIHAIAISALLLIVVISSAKAADITVSNGWIRALPGDEPAGGYFTLHNGTAKKVSLTGAVSLGCGSMTLHQSVSTSGMSGMAGMSGMGAMTSMKDVARVDVPPGATIKFSPGGYHVMCMNPTKAIHPGGSVGVTLDFSDGTKVNSIFTVLDATGK